MTAPVKVGDVDLLRAIQSTSRWGGNTADEIGHELGLTPRAAAAKLRGAARRDLCESFHRDAIWRDPDVYWNLLPDGRRLLAEARS